ncbi:hypothetical protein CFR77_11340 [Komagataeibacter sucrofermentans]|uniref:Uncharacterized protein n=2 Tax=Komagataeibacter sucrofermentans TaxID=1053551 RepID=A0A318QFP9_9PROT|nr:hypothetical protein CFR77_11340 [Komagataeibacter sucrofermentans]
MGLTALYTTPQGARAGRMTATDQADRQGRAGAKAVANKKRENLEMFLVKLFSKSFESMPSFFKKAAPIHS